MSAVAEALSNHAIAIEPHDMLGQHAFALVQDNLIISTFPGHQAAAAIDLARVLCRALGQPVDVFRFQRCPTERVQAGAIADANRPEWLHFAHVHATFLRGIKIDLHDPDLRDAAGQPYATP
jgi:hypothetical protein